jgi:hypothetical protein
MSLIMRRAITKHNPPHALNAMMWPSSSLNFRCGEGYNEEWPPNREWKHDEEVMEVPFSHN